MHSELFIKLTLFQNDVWLLYLDYSKNSFTLALKKNANTVVRTYKNTEFDKIVWSV